jgi:hypothetical protein
MTTLRVVLNWFLTSSCSSGDSANPPTRNRCDTLRMSRDKIGKNKKKRKKEALALDEDARKLSLRNVNVTG